MRVRTASSANWWWECSPNSGNSKNFCNVNNDGSANNNNASNNNGLAVFGYIIHTRVVAKVKLMDLMIQESVILARKSKFVQAPCPA